MIGITCALPTESSGLRARLREQRKDHGLVRGELDGHAVTICHTGVGAKNCNERLEALLHVARPRLVISSGFAGAVVDEFKVGDLILAQNFSDPALLGRAKQILRDRNPRVAQLFTSPSIIDSISERNEIARASGAAAVDMETGLIAEICKAHGIPLLSLRVISDTPSEPFPAPPRVLFEIEKQRTSYARLLAYLLRYPGAIPKLTSFSKRIAQVRATLTDALVALVQQL